VKFWERLTENKLYLDETDKVLEIDRSQVAEKQRLLVGVAGPPGCGKSAFAGLLKAVINGKAGEDLACVVGMDGWHYPNAILESRFVEREGQQVSLRSIKGSPETFDAQAMLRCLALIRQGGEVHFPVYSRQAHDPLPEAGLVRENQRIVIVEGNYLFLDQPPWDAFRSLFGLQVFLKASLKAIRASLEERHRRGGKPPDWIDRHLCQVDLPNAQRVLSSLSPGMIVVHKEEARTIQYIEGLDSHV
jgi:pantothenate kinase